MGLFSFLKRSPAPAANTTPATIKPYSDSAVNHIYNLLFCDDLKRFQRHVQEPYRYPYDTLFATTADVAELQKITVDTNLEPRIKMLAYNRLLAAGQKPAGKVLLAVIVELGLADGLDVLASYSNGTARYINSSGKLILWETKDDMSDKLTQQLFEESEMIVHKIGPWNKHRLPQPTKGQLRITFLVSDGLAFGQGPIDTMFNDAIAAPALNTATMLMAYLMEERGSARDV